MADATVGGTAATATPRARAPTAPPHPHGGGRRGGHGAAHKAPRHDGVAFAVRAGGVRSNSPTRPRRDEWAQSNRHRRALPPSLRHYHPHVSGARPTVPSAANQAASAADKFVERLFGPPAHAPAQAVHPPASDKVWSSRTAVLQQTHGSTALTSAQATQGGSTHPMGGGVPDERRGVAPVPQAWMHPTPPRHGKPATKRFTHHSRSRTQAPGPLHAAAQPRNLPSRPHTTPGPAARAAPHAHQRGYRSPAQAPARPSAAALERSRRQAVSGPVSPRLHTPGVAWGSPRSTPVATSQGTRVHGTHKKSHSGGGGGGGGKGVSSRMDKFAVLTRTGARYEADPSGVLRPSHPPKASAIGSHPASSEIHAAAPQQESRSELQCGSRWRCCNLQSCSVAFEAVAWFALCGAVHIHAANAELACVGMHLIHVTRADA